MRYYAGVGSRETPADVLLLMTRAAAWLAKRGWVLRSGHAPGADRAFERGAAGKATVYLPEPHFGQRPYEDDPGEPVSGHAVWLAPTVYERQCTDLVRLGVLRSLPKKPYVRWLHGRNCNQVLGHAGEAASSFVLCWCPEVNGTPQGGTATAVKLARLHGIEVRNLFHPEVRARVEVTVNQ